MGSVLYALCLSLVSTAEAPADAEAKTKVVVMPFQASGISPGAVGTLNELLVDAIRRQGKHEVIGQSDIDAMLGLENLKDELGCDEVACAAEIGGALGAELLISGRVARLGSSIIIVLKLINGDARKVENSIKHKATSDENLYDQAVEDAVAQLFGDAPAPLAADSSPDDLLRGFISSVDFNRFETYKSSSGRHVSLADWVNEQNRESNAMFLGEIAAGALMLLSAGGVTSSFDTQLGKNGEEGPPVVFTIGFVALAALLVVDVLDMGAVEVTGM